jgi:hypothetical protein
MRISQLQQIVPPPRHPVETGSHKAWQQVQTRLGTPLPADYKTFIDRYGTGAFHNFLVLYNPFSKQEDRDLFLALDTYHQANRRVQGMTSRPWSVVKPFELYPAEGGLLPWGTTARMAQSFFWQVDGPPENWITILYHLQTGEYEVWKLPFSIFIRKLLTRQIESVLLPDDFPPRHAPIQYNQPQDLVFYP